MGPFSVGFCANCTSRCRRYLRDAGSVGARNAASLVGIAYTSVAIGTLIGPSAAGFAYDTSHSYMLPILMSIVAYVIATAIPAATTTKP